MWLCPRTTRVIKPPGTWSPCACPACAPRVRERSSQLGPVQEPPGSERPRDPETLAPAQQALNQLARGAPNMALSTNHPGHTSPRDPEPLRMPSRRSTSSPAERPAWPGPASHPGQKDPETVSEPLRMPSRRSTSSRAVGRALASTARHSLMRSTTSCGHSSGALGTRMRPRRGAWCRV